MSFGMWLFAFFCSPAYFAARGRWGAFCLNAVFYGLAVILLISMVGAILAPLFWLVGVAHAGWDMRSVMMEEAMQRQAELIAQKMAKEQKAS